MAQQIPGYHVNVYLVNEKQISIYARAFELDTAADTAASHREYPAPLPLHER